MPKVSVCIPTYNNLELFKKCLNSVLVQEFKDYEIIVSDDSNNDEIEYYLNGLNHLNDLTTLCKWCHEYMHSPDDYDEMVEQEIARLMQNPNS